TNPDVYKAIVEGGANFNYVIFGVEDDTDHNPTDKFQIIIDSIEVYNKDPLEVTYGLYHSESDASSKTAVIPYTSKSDVLLKFDSAYDPDCGSVTTKKIDVKDEFKSFENGETVTPIGAVDLSISGSVLNKNCCDFGLASILGNNNELGIEGDFNACGDVFIDFDGDCDPTTLPITSATINGDKNEATFTLTVAELSSVNSTSRICMEVNGTTPINGGPYTAKFTADVAAGGSYPSGEQELCTSEVSRSGSSARVTFAITEAGVYRNYVRITNPSNLDGKVYMTVIADDGTSVAIELGNVSGITSSVLNKGASTKLIDVNDIYKAAQTKSPGFSHGDGNLRIDFSGEFGTNDRIIDGDTLGPESRTAIIVNAFGISRDGNSVFMLP
ncbi:hypothetical protein QUF80_23005, partial [Desulfococcaceae bacterium HSG8]|nr:hypothetical protein [Desulfococcaceae bacterium HSG8]